LLVLESSVKVATRDGGKELPIGTVYRDYFETIIEPGELVESVTIPVPSASSRGVYMRFEVRKAMDKAMPGVAALVQLEDDGKTIRWARIAMSGVGAIPLRFPKEEAFLVGKEFSPESAEALARMVEERVEPVAEHHYSTEYKKVVAGIMARRAVAEAIRRASSAV
jgi:carbon-monoxide dehydrogenase medium subunit